MLSGGLSILHIALPILAESTCRSARSIKPKRVIVANSFIPPIASSATLAVFDSVPPRKLVSDQQSNDTFSGCSKQLEQYLTLAGVLISQSCELIPRLPIEFRRSIMARS